MAAELLMPMDALNETYDIDAPVADEIQRLAHLFKVSSLVALRVYSMPDSSTGTLFG